MGVELRGAEKVECCTEEAAMLHLHYRKIYPEAGIDNTGMLDYCIIALGRQRSDPSLIIEILQFLKEPEPWQTRPNQVQML
jgi:hypothetical protein